MGSRVSVSSLLSSEAHRVPKEPKQLPSRDGVSKFFRCEAPFLHHHEIEGTIMPSLRAQKPWTRPRLQASLSAAPSHHCSGLFAHAKRGQPAWRVPFSENLESHGLSRRHS